MISKTWKLTSDEKTVSRRSGFLEHIRGMIRLLGEWPHLGHVGIVGGTYERTVPRTPYVIVYRIDLGTRDELIVLRVPHAAQDRSRDR